MKYKFLKNDYFFSLVNKAVAFLTGFITAALLNRYLGPILKGEYAYIMNIVNFVSIAANLGIYQSYPKSYKEKMPDVKKKYVTLIYALFFFYVLIAVIMGGLGKSLFYMCVFLLVPLQTTANQLSMVIMVEEIRYRQYIQIIAQVTKTLLIVVLICVVPVSLLAVLILLGCINLFQCILYSWRLSVKPSLCFLDKKFLCRVAGVGLYACVSELLLIMNYKADVFMLKTYVDYYQIGLYSVGAGIAECIWMIPDAFKEVLYSRTSRSNPIKEINLTIKINMLVSFFVIIIMLFWGKAIIIVYSGFEYLEALRVTQIIMFGVPVMGLFKITNPLYLANGKQKLYCAILAISVFVNIVLNLMLIPVAGIYGAAIASVVSFSVCGITFYIKYIQEYHIRWYEPIQISKRDIADLKSFFTKG